MTVLYVIIGLVVLFMIGSFILRVIKLGLALIGFLIILAIIFGVLQLIAT
ncbi:hypothetical protein [Mycoplasmopsis canis]|uniref:Uncharacterized protein n=1 Tax=Mycoplasmopsis canis TaxID=29555 RepID=A0A449AQR9_9BACT|nr:hypothetical protein [Mycoplasmopsis canis]VEU68898.1 Uncharacterised protein [Mycoplasmopsis canis]